MTKPDIPFDQFTYEELEMISIHVENARNELRAALEILDGTDCAARDRLAQANAPLVYLGPAVTGCITLKAREENSQ